MVKILFGMNDAGRRHVSNGGAALAHCVCTDKAAQKRSRAFMPDEAAPISNNTLKELS